ncbi:hypothetical protein ACN4EK_09020 [Pantanalinema rosaneae CENA516]|uniref:hypothetical protein n=1 Tax=Pantanalinema rosaneae TaxID=1620701 RepID=UPI003D6EF5CE
MKPHFKSPDLFISCRNLITEFPQIKAGITGKSFAQSSAFLAQSQTNFLREIASKSGLLLAGLMATDAI